MTSVFAIGVPILLVGFLLALALREQPLSNTAPADEQPGPDTADRELDEPVAVGEA